MAQHERHEPQDDKYARESFSFRTMKRWQLWGITLVAAAVVVALVAYGMA